VVVLHDLALAAQYAERAIILEDGKVWYDGDCQNIDKQFAQLQLAQKKGEMQGKSQFQSVQAA
jgi:ABC-type phosphate/phosphonate transport system ATPase subunit